MKGTTTILLTDDNIEDILSSELRSWLDNPSYAEGVPVNVFLAPFYSNGLCYRNPTYVEVFLTTIAFQLDPVNTRPGDFVASWDYITEARMAGLSVSDPEMREVFGPQYQELLSLINAENVLTTAQRRLLVITMRTQREGLGDLDWPLFDSRLGRAAGMVTRQMIDPQSIIKCTAQALVLRNQIDKRTYDHLTFAWRTVIGPLHEEDKLC